jgi:predicted PhzF superfamily epimerase YddE/YHI9
LRWFSPEIEVDLCGHATLASAHVLWRHAGEKAGTLTFHTKSGALTVTDEFPLMAMNFPARAPIPMKPPANVREVLSVPPRFCGQARDYLFLLESESEVRALRPDIAGIAAWETFGVIVTAPGDKTDFVSRFFVPRAGIAEDPATGSTHCTLVPYWAEKLGRAKLSARQVSARGGEMFCEALGDRVKIAGEARTYFHGAIEL